nr:reverse transcriptase domain-containing protein [Tanacetum cinerariifolium]
MDLKQREVVKAKSSIEEPLKLELKDLPSHLEHVYLEGVDKLPVIIKKDLKDNEKEALLKVLKSHKRVIAWKITDIKDIDPRFCTYKILMEEDCKPVVEVSNRGLKRILERTVGENRTSWSEKLEDALWAFRTTYKTPIGCTRYKLVYGKSCHLPIELEHKAYWALKHVNFDLKTVGKTKKLHDFKIKNRIFNVGDQVLLFNSRLKIFSGKHKIRWSGPFTITNVFPYGTVELSQPEGPNFKVNGHCMKHYSGGDIPQSVVSDL